MLTLCGSCGSPLNHVPAWVDEFQIEDSVILCSGCERCTVYEYTEEEIEELKEYFTDRREDLDQLNEREKTLYDFLGGTDGEVSDGGTPSGMEDTEPCATIEDSE